MSAPAGTAASSWLQSPALRWLLLVLLLAAYLQGGIVKLFDFPGAVDEMRHFGLEPAAPLAAAVIALELGASALVLGGRLRWLGALALAAFTVGASLLANRFWAAPPAERFTLENSFCEHLGLAGGLLLVAWLDWRELNHARMPR